jgi:hypothetical protein
MRRVADRCRTDAKFRTSAAASWPLEVLEDFVRQRLVEVRRYGELAGAKTEGAELRGRRGHGPDLPERLFAADNEERFARLDALEEGEKVALNVLYADGTHAIILTGGRNGTSRHRWSGPRCWVL